MCVFRSIINARDLQLECVRVSHEILLMYRVHSQSFKTDLRKNNLFNIFVQRTKNL